MEPKEERKKDAFYCEICNIDCFTKVGMAMHCQTRIHSINQANSEFRENEEEEEEPMDDVSDNVTYCSLCQVECKTPDGFYRHLKSVSHMMQASESGAVETVQDNQGDDDGNATYCSVCRVECKTSDGFFMHSKSVSHMMRASASGTMETVQDNQVTEVNDEDMGPLYCRACKLMCQNDYEFSSHTQTIGHHMKQSKYDKQQRFGDNHAPSQQWSSGPHHHDRKRSYASNRLDHPKDPYRYEEQVVEPKPHPDHPELLVDAIEPGISLCTICNVRLRPTNFTDHVQAPRHRRRLRAVSAGGSIYVHTAGLAIRPLPGLADRQKEIDEDKHSLVGMEYIYEIHRRTTIGKPYYLCALCDVGSIDIISHSTSKDHRQLYFKKHSEELEDIIWPFVPRPDTDFYPWYRSKYMRHALETETVTKRPKPPQETTMLVRMATAVCKKHGVQRINKHEEIRGKLVRPDGYAGKDPYPNVKPIDKWNAKRLFVGNLPQNVNEMDLLDFLNRQTINRAIIDLEMGKDKKFTFITFRTYEDASQFLIFDGIVFKDTEIRVTRPHNYRPLPGQDDAKVLIECSIPRAALLYNKVLPYPRGSKHTNCLHIKGLPGRFEPDIILDYINSLVLGTPATGVNEIRLNHKENWACFVTFRSTEETTDVLEAALGELFHFKPINISRPTNYISPEEVLATNEASLPMPQMPPGGKRQMGDLPPLYTNFQKISRMEPSLNDGFRGGSVGFVKPGDVGPPVPCEHPRTGPPGPYGVEGPHYHQQGYGFDRTQGQGHGASGYGNNQGQGDPQRQQSQIWGHDPSRGQYHGEGGGHSQAHSQFQGHGPNQNQFQGQGRNQLGHGGQRQNQNQNPPPPRLSGPPQPGPGGPPPRGPASSAGGLASPPLTGPPPYSIVKLPVAKLPPPKLPPPPKITQLTAMLKETKELLTNDTICTDEEAAYAQQVAMQLAGGLNVYNANKNLTEKMKPYSSMIQASKDADLEEWLKYMTHFLDKGRIALEEEASLAREVGDMLTEEVKKYKDRCTVTPADMTKTATTSPAAVVSTALPPPPAYNYQNYMGYGQYYDQWTNPSNMSY